jgi:hypothetical protein
VLVNVSYFHTHLIFTIEERILDTSAGKQQS